MRMNSPLSVSLDEMSTLMLFLQEIAMLLLGIANNGLALTVQNYKDTQGRN